MSCDNGISVPSSGKAVDDVARPIPPEPIPAVVVLVMAALPCAHDAGQPRYEAVEETPGAGDRPRTLRDRTRLARVVLALAAAVALTSVGLTTVGGLATAVWGGVFLFAVEGARRAR